MDERERNQGSRQRKRATMKDFDGGGERFAKGVDVGGAADRLRCRLIRRSCAEVLSLLLCGKRGDAKVKCRCLLICQIMSCFQVYSEFDWKRYNHDPQ